MTDLTFFSDRSRDIAMATNFRVTMGKSADSPSFVALAFLNVVEYCNPISKASSAMNWLQCVKIWRTYGPVTPEFKRSKMYTPRRSVDQ